MAESRPARIGPRLDGFNAAFGVGAQDAPVHPVDGAGVALAAIQGLHRLLEEQAAELEELRARVQALTPPP
jgi:hypothetical protein